MRYFLLSGFLLAILFPSLALAYPGCYYRDITLGGQMWASCNVSAKGNGSEEKSGWFLAGDVLPRFISYNGYGAGLEYQKNIRSRIARQTGACAQGYRIPTRGEWETALYYARLNNTSLSKLLNLPNNGGYRTFHDTEGDIVVEEREDVTGSYWSSTYDTIWGYESPIVLHLGENTRGARFDGTSGLTIDSGYQFQYGDDGIKLVGGERTEMANVRCIRKF